MRKRLRERLPVLLLLGCAAAALYVSGIGCPFRFLLGVSCPGCGMTRACLTLVRTGDLSAAMRLHPLVIFLLPGALYLLLAKRPYGGSARREQLLFCAVAGLLIAVWCVRLLTGDPVTAIDLSSGVWYTCLSDVYALLKG